MWMKWKEVPRVMYDSRMSVELKDKKGFKTIVRPTLTESAELKNEVNKLYANDIIR